MDINTFIHERRPVWMRLSNLLDKGESGGIDSLASREARELYECYRQACSDLNRAQTATANPEILRYLEGLVGRAYGAIHRPPKRRPFRGWWRIVRSRFPAIIRREYRLVSLAAIAFLAGTLFGFVASFVAPETREVLVPGEHLAQSPSERVRHLEDLERSGDSRVSTVSDHSAFTTLLFTHNIRVACLGFVLGFTFGVGTIVVLFLNGAMLGALAAWYYEENVMTFFLGWVGPHGAIEIPCVLFGCAAGLMIARAQFRKDEGPFLSQLKRLRGDLIDILVGTATLLVLAGIVEGGFSQINEPTLSYSLKIGVAVVLFVALMAYLFALKRREEPAIPLDS